MNTSHYPPSEIERQELKHSIEKLVNKLPPNELKKSLVEYALESSLNIRLIAELEVSLTEANIELQKAAERYCPRSEVAEH